MARKRPSSTSSPLTNTPPTGTPKSSQHTVRSSSAPPDYRVNENYEELLKAFGHYYTSLPITLCIEKSPIIMKDLYKRLKTMPKRIIAPDGYIPNSKIRKLLQPEPVTVELSQQCLSETASQKLHLEQLIKRYLSDERTKDTLSSITVMKDVALLRVATSSAGAEKMRNEMMANLAIEVEGLLEQPCEVLFDDEHMEDDEAARMQKSAKLHKFARQITKQTVQKHFEQKIKESLKRHGIERKVEEEESFIEEVEEEQFDDPTNQRSALAPTNWRQEEDLIDRIERDNTEAIKQRQKLETERILPYEFVKNNLEKLAAELGGMARVMDVIYGAIQKKQSDLEKLDSILRSREARVGMINSIVSPTWAMFYLSNLCGSERIAMEHLDTLLDPESSPDVVTSLKVQLMKYLGNARRLEQYCCEFSSVRGMVENTLVTRGMPKDAARNLIFEAIAGNKDAKTRIANWMQLPDIEELLHALKSCNKDRVIALAEQSMAARRTEMTTLSSTDLLDRTKESADASLLAQLDADARRVMQYDGKLEENFDDDGTVPAPSQLKVQLGKKPESQLKIIEATPLSSSDLSASTKESMLDSHYTASTKEIKIAVKPERILKEKDYAKDEDQNGARMKRKTASEEHAEFLMAAKAGGLEPEDGQLRMRARSRTGGSVVRVRKELQKGRKETVPQRETHEESEHGTIESVDEIVDETEGYDLSVMDAEIVLSDEDLAQILKVVETERVSSEPQITATVEASVTEGTDTRPARYPEQELLQGQVKRFQANPTEPGPFYLWMLRFIPDHLIVFETVFPTADTEDVLMKNVVGSKWFLNKDAQMKKEVIAVEIMRVIPNIKDHVDLEEAENALILLKRQFGVGVNCAKYVVKQASKLFPKYLEVLKHVRKTGVGSKEDTFIRAVTMLSIMNNYSEDVTEGLEQLESEPVKARVAGTSKTAPMTSKMERIKEGGRKEKPKVQEYDEQSQEEVEIVEQGFDKEVEITEQSLALSPEEKEKLRLKHQQEVNAKIRSKMQEKRAEDRVNALMREKSLSKKTTESSPASYTPEDASEDIEEDEHVVDIKHQLHLKKQALKNRETESSSSHEHEIRELEEELAIAKLKAKQQRRAHDQDRTEERATSSRKKQRTDERLIESPRSSRGRTPDAKSRPPSRRVPAAKGMEFEESSEKLDEHSEEAPDTPLLRFPAVRSTVDRQSISSSVKDFLLKQGKIVGSGMVPSVSLKALSDALKNPEQASQAEEVIDIIRRELGVDEVDPVTLIKRMKDQMDHMPEQKHQPINKMINLLSMLLAVESEESSSDSKEGKRISSLTLLEQSEVERQRLKVLATLVDDITSQLKYEYSMMNELGATQRSVWMILETQTDAMRECCEKIGFIVSSNAMTPELASFITSLFTMDLIDYESMLRRGKNLSETEHKTIYRQSRILLEVLSWFDVKPGKLIKSIEEFSYLEDYTRILEKPPHPQVDPHQMEIVLPESYLNLIETEFFADFATVQIVSGEERQPLEEMYTGQKYSVESVDGATAKKKKNMLQLMTQRLADIKRTFDHPTLSIDPNSPLVRLSAKLLDGINMLTEDEETEASKSSAVDQHKKILAYETGKIPITSKAFALANSLRLHRKTIPNIQRQRPASAVGNLEEPSTLKSTVTPKLYVRSLRKTTTPESKEVLALLPSMMLRGPLKSRRHKRPLYQTGSLALVAKVGERRSVPQPVTPQTAQKPIYIGHDERPVHLASGRTVQMQAPMRASAATESKLSVRRAKVLLTRQRRANFLIPDSLQQVKSLHSEQILTADVLESMIRIESSRGSYKTEETKLDSKVKKFDGRTTTPIPSTQSILSNLASSNESSPQRTPTSKFKSKEIELRSEEEQDISEPLAEIDETTNKVAGVWTWLDTLLTAKTKAAETPHSVLQAFRIEAREKASSGFARSKTPKMITMLEEKVSRLQHLVQDIEETEVWHPPTEMSRPAERKTPPTGDKRPGYSFYSVTAPAFEKSQQIKTKHDDSKKYQTLAKEKDLPQTRVLPKLRRRFIRYKPNEYAVTSVEKMTANLDTATQYLQSVLPPGRLTELLTKIQSEKTPTDAMTTLEEALLQAAEKARDAENELSPYARGTPRPSQVPITQWRMLGIPTRSQNRQPDTFRSTYRGVHCRYALLAHNGFHKQNLSIGAHLARMDLVDCINKSIQQRAYHRIQSSMVECLKKVIN
ncbi:hypothetical protein PHET_02848 [Paragonimus heterotremus]|uniref:Uncharacterized protein n=1 Tax=Paragonimus heterotremus TaxID=100268 RepID=A0A8J4SQA0_9TREM|nr:hypothetical protein PHET_02848 [Paragonimus heterotremus]